MRGLIWTCYAGYCTIESVPTVPGADRAAYGIEYLQLCERIARSQLSLEYPNGFAIPGASS